MFYDHWILHGDKCSFLSRIAKTSAFLQNVTITGYKEKEEDEEEEDEEQISFNSTILSHRLAF